MNTESAILYNPGILCILASKKAIAAMNKRDQPTKIVRQLRGGQMTIPADFRKELGIKENSMLQITLTEGELRVRPVEVAERPQGSAWLKELYDEFAPARQEIIDRGYSEDEVNSMIDDAIAAVRSKL